MRKILLSLVLCALAFVPVSAFVTDVTANFTCGNSSTAMCDGSKWTVELGGNWGIFGNEAYAPGATGIVAWTDTTFSNDQYVTVTVGSIPAGSNDLAPCIRVQNDGLGNGYCIVGNTLYAIVAGVNTTAVASSCTTASSAGDTMKLDATGTTITYFKNGVSACSGTDATFGSGYPGMYASVTNKTLSAFVAGPTSGGGGATIQPGQINSPVRGGGRLLGSALWR